LEWGIKFRPIKPRSPHLNGKVERSQRTDLEEFYPTVDLSSNNVPELLQEWQYYHNWGRPYSSLGGKTPIDRGSECLDKIPLQKEVQLSFDPYRKMIRDSNYQQDLQLRNLKPSM
jgi:hypothetical protein